MTVTVTNPEGEIETITTTTEHPFYVIEQGFIETGQLKAGQQLATASGKPATLTEVNLTPITLTAYNYEVAFNHTYFVGKAQLWVHNACGDVAKNATSSNQGANLREHLRQTERYGKGGTKDLPNGRTLYYGETVPSRTPGEMAGRRTVRE